MAKFSKVGAGIGFAAGGPFGAAVGGFADKLFAPGEASGYSRSDIERLTNTRHQQIQDFAGNLAQARQRYLSNLGNLQNLTFGNFGKQAEAQFAGRGLQVTGGGFQSALARRATELQAEGALAGSQMEREDLTNVNQAFAGLSGQQLNIAAANPFQRAPNPFLQFAGQTAGMAGQAALLAAMGKPPTPTPGTVIRG